MTTRIMKTLALSAALLGGIASAQAQDHSMHNSMGMPDGKPMKMKHTMFPSPIGIMGDHMHKKGKLVFTYRHKHMNMEGNRMGTSDASPDFIATNVPNRFFGNPGQPPTLRIVPTKMEGNMHMFGAMYSTSDRVTLMAMVPYIEKRMTAQTYQGPAGTTVLGSFQTKTEGFGDVKVSALVGILANKNHRLNLNFGLSLPTGSITERGDMLSPMGTMMNMRMAYGMQLGSGTYDLLPGITYAGNNGKFGWGAQARANIRLGRNDEGYSLGDKLTLNAWTSVQPQPWYNLSARIEATSLGRIDGIDPNIMGPMQAADPDNYGGNRINLYAGANLMPKKGLFKGHRFGLEVGAPVYQDLNGVQLKQDWSLNAGWQAAF